MNLNKDLSGLKLWDGGFHRREVVEAVHLERRRVTVSAWDKES